MALLRDVRVSLLGREWTESDVTECLRDCGWTVAEAAAMYARGTTLYSTRMRFCFEEALSADPLCIGPHNTVLGGIGASAPEDIAPGAYVAALAPMAPPRVLVVRADTGVGKTTQCRSMLTARTSGAFDEASDRPKVTNGSRGHEGTPSTHLLTHDRLGHSEYSRVCRCTPPGCSRG